MRRPRAYPRVALAAAAVVVAMGGATVAGRALLTGTHAPGTANGTASPALHRLKETAVPPMEKVWPKAIHRVPDTLPNRRKFLPLTFLDAHTLLVSTDSSFEKADALYAYDLREHTTRRIATVVTPPKTKLFASGFSTGDGYVAWYLAGDYGTEIWAAPLAGGAARLVSRADTPVPTALAIDGGKVLWSVGKTGGVFRAPVTGGATEKVPGTRGTYILQWPWVGAPAAVLPPNTGVTGFANVRNVVTGETRTARLTDGAAWSCGVTWCVGRDSHLVSEAQRRDGSGRQAIPDLESASRNPPSLDRFVITFPAKHSIAVYDLRTGKAGDLGIKQQDKNSFVFRLADDPANRLYYTITDGGYVLVDLGAI
ncbi:hypothetical protein Airi01_017280 [Actinoallomurus iriomotensis]|uniref:WD40 repeat domain-containing protein n=2 Tax=Actinoallomurus iriomotensis TaxID=478107 RepID=A0A9W6VPC8_9ACTN|nr:hypothetical protein Airi01_017280 [Actinoallomurus iriomotensis]